MTVKLVIPHEYIENIAAYYFDDRIRPGLMRVCVNAIKSGIKDGNCNTHQEVLDVLENAMSEILPLTNKTEDAKVTT